MPPAETSEMPVRVRSSATQARITVPGPTAICLWRLRLLLWRFRFGEEKGWCPSRFVFAETCHAFPSPTRRLDVSFVADRESREAFSEGGRDVCAAGSCVAWPPFRRWSDSTTSSRAVDGIRFEIIAKCCQTRQDEIYLARLQLDFGHCGVK